MTTMANILKSKVDPAVHTIGRAASVESVCRALGGTTPLAAATRRTASPACSRSLLPGKRQVEKEILRLQPQPPLAVHRHREIDRTPCDRWPHIGWIPEVETKKA